MKHRFMEIEGNGFFSITLKIVLSQAGIKKVILFLPVFNLYIKGTFSVIGNYKMPESDIPFSFCKYKVHFFVTIATCILYYLYS